MLVSKNITNRTHAPPQSLTIGDAVRVVNTNQIGTVESYRGGRWSVRLSEGSTIECDLSNLEKRQLLVE